MNIKLPNPADEQDDLTLAGNAGIDAALEDAVNAPATAPAADPAETEANDEDAEASNGEATSNIKAEVRKVLSTIVKIGTEFGTGKKALFRLAMTVTEGAQEQVIKPDLAKKIYEKFRQSSDKKAVTAGGALLGAGGSEGSKAVQISKLNAFIKFGNEWREDATDVMERAAEVHARLMANDKDKALLKLTSTYSALVQVAREHIKKDNTLNGVPMTDEQLQDLFLGEETAAKTGADYIVSAIKAAKQARDGKPATDEKDGRAAVTDAGLETVMADLYAVLGRIDPDKHAALVKADAKAAEKLAAKARKEVVDEDDAEHEGEEAAE